MIVLGDRTVASSEAPYFVAELSGNHQQSIEKAKALIAAAAEAGADAVKLQTYTPDTITLPVRNELFQLDEGLWKGRYLHDLYAEAMTPWEWHKALLDFAASLGLVLFSTPFDESAVDFLETELDPLVYKIASFEVNHIPLLKKVGQTRKPIIMSTGMASESEITLAVETLKQAGAAGIVLLKCVSAYPADPTDFNLRSLQLLREAYGCEVGLSDHSLTPEMCYGAVALGASLIEKHMVLDRSEGGIDSGFSLEPQEFADMVAGCKKLHSGMGKAVLGPTAQDARQQRFKRSIFVSRGICAGELFTEDNLKIVRPANGMSPVEWEKVLGKKATCDLVSGEPLKQSHIGE